jgi:hypothetical protein
MALIFDQDHTLGHYFWGTSRSDVLMGNGSGGVVIVGGAGNDNLSSGIVSHDAPRTWMYGDFVLPGFGHPVFLTGGRELGARPGNDILNYGFNIGAKGNEGADTYIFHGPGPKVAGHTATTPTVDFFEGDVLRFDGDQHNRAHPDGFMFTNFRGAEFERNGKQFFHLIETELHAYSNNPVVREQVDILGFRDDGRGEYHPVEIPFLGDDPSTAVNRWLHGEVGDHIFG